MAQQPEFSTGSGGVGLGALSVLMRELAAPERQGEAWQDVPLPGTKVGRFELLRELGRGGFGTVWEARDRELGRSVALKLVRPGRRPGSRKGRLRHEARAAACLSHDNVVAVHEVGNSDLGPYLVFELLNGKTLAERLREGRLEQVEALRVFREVTKGVAHAHEEGVVHRDLKPANVFLCDDGRVKVLDFGLSRAVGQRCQSGGTPAYMAPEQWREAPEDERTDVFALGVMLFELLAGELPFGGEKETLRNWIRAPALETPGAPALAGLVARMLEKDPVDRPRDGGEVLASLDRALAAEAPGGPVQTRRRLSLRLAAFFAAGIALGAGGLFALHAARPRLGEEATRKALELQRPE